MDMISLVPETLLGTIVALWLIGYFLKQTEKIKDCYIPFILMVFSIAASLVIEGLTVQSAIQGIICVGIAVLGNNFVKQGMEAFNNSLK